MTVSCPNCDATIHSRRALWCGSCGADIPATLRMSDEAYADEQRQNEDGETKVGFGLPSVAYGGLGSADGWEGFGAGGCDTGAGGADAGGGCS